MKSKLPISNRKTKLTWRKLVLSLSTYSSTLVCTSFACSHEFSIFASEFQFSSHLLISVSATKKFDLGKLNNTKINFSKIAVKSFLFLGNGLFPSNFYLPIHENKFLNSKTQLISEIDHFAGI